MEEILKEQQFQASGCASEECVVEMGQLIGVDRMVAGSIGKIGPLFIISLRLLDVGTGEIMKNVSEQIEGDVTDLVRIGIVNVAKKMADLPVENRVQKNAAPKAEKRVEIPAARRGLTRPPWEMAGLKRDRYDKMLRAGFSEEEILKRRWVKIGMTPLEWGKFKRSGLTLYEYKIRPLRRIQVSHFIFPYTIHRYLKVKRGNLYMILHNVAIIGFVIANLNDAGPENVKAQQAFTKINRYSMLSLLLAYGLGIPDGMRTARAYKQRLKKKYAQYSFSPIYHQQRVGLALQYSF